MKKKITLALTLALVTIFTSCSNPKIEFRKNCLNGNTEKIYAFLDKFAQENNFDNKNQEEKNEILERFIKNESQILISTTVIEVGVNVPNATVMMVENAERFGLAQLHQLRGRVGRGKEKSYRWISYWNVQYSQRTWIFKRPHTSFLKSKKSVPFSTVRFFIFLPRRLLCYLCLHQVEVCRIRYKQVHYAPM